MLTLLVATLPFGSMKRVLCSLLVATLPFGSVLADMPKEKNAKVTLVYQHELPNVLGKSIKGVLVGEVEELALPLRAVRRRWQFGDSSVARTSRARDTGLLPRSACTSSPTRFGYGCGCIYASADRRETSAERPRCRR